LKIESLAEKLADHRIGYAKPKEFVPDEELIQRSRAELARVMTIVTSFERILEGPVQEEAFGAPGDSGDPVLIEHLARRQADILDDLLDWSLGLLSLAAESDESRSVFETISRYAAQPIRAIQQFARDYRDHMDGMAARLQAGENVSVEMTIRFEIPQDVLDSYEVAARAFEAMRA
jgi:hypothetical protein